MTKSTMSMSFLGAALVALCGCGPELDQVTPGAKEATWEKNISESYDGYRRPRTAPPAIVDSMSPRLVESERAATSGVPSDVKVDEVNAPAPIDDVAPAPVDEVKPEAAATPVEEVKSDAPAPKSAEKSDATPEKTGSVVWHEVKAGETLGAIAKQYYGDARKYDLILRANEIKDARKIQIGTKLAIPQL